MEWNLAAIGRRDRQILCGLFLSKYDRAALDYLGFASFTEAFNTLGYSLQARPASIKNYRDELDPYFPNPRKGWHKRALRDHCQRILEMYRDATLRQLGDLIQTIVFPHHEITASPEVQQVLFRHKADENSSFAKRLITGLAAERYFTAHYAEMPEFTGKTLTDTTHWGCGFDFKVTTASEDSYDAVEVKGLRYKSGQIQLTHLEWDMAQALRQRYYLVLVRNFAEVPFHTVIPDPAHANLDFLKTTRKETRVSWSAHIAES
jgi:hypothetical protein